MNDIPNSYPIYKVSSTALRKMLLCVLTYLGLLLPVSPASAKTIYHVSPTGGGDGSSWALPATLLEALAAAQEGDEIWVQGFETVDSRERCYVVPGELPEGFTLREGIKLYGGFAGTETSVDERVTSGRTFNFVYRSVLSGDTEINDKVDASMLIFPSNTTRSDNATHVLNVHSGTGNTTTTVDGFTITNGHADGDGEHGGGIYVTGKGGNYAIEKCYFVKNYATLGGAIYVEADAGSNTSSISQCGFFNNAAGERSSGINSGGGVCIAGYGHIDNCVITNNENGGVLLGTGAYVINATIARNSVAGADLLMENTNGGIQIYNSVIWGNTTLSAAHQPGLSHCGYPQCDPANSENGNIYVSERNNEQSEYAPRFDSPSSQTGFDTNANDSHTNYPTWIWSFPYNSVLVDKGVENDVTTLQSKTDIIGVARISNGLADIGAYEYQAVAADRIRYVKMNATGSGRSWDDAMGDLQNAIDDLAGTSGEPGEVWVAEGVYEPHTQMVMGKTETVYFLMRDGISVYGGFAGTESSKSERAMKTGGMPWDFEHETILQGNHYDGICTWNSISNCWEPTSNSRHIVWMAPHAGAPAFKYNTELNGFTIQGGYADGDGDDTYKPGRGAGVYMSSSTTLSNCIVRENRAYHEGGGVFMNTGKVESCLIYNNSSIHSNGGAVFMDNSGLVRHCAIINNSAHNGGGVYMDRNRVTAGQQYHPEYLILTSSIVSNNHSTENGAVFCNKGGIVLQSTIVNNYTPRATDNAASDASQTGGVYANEYALVINSILWNNMNNTTRIPMYAQAPTSKTVRFINTAISDAGNAVWNNVLQQDVYEISSVNTTDESGVIAPFFNPAGTTMTSDDALYANVGIQKDWRRIDYFWIPKQGSPMRALGLTLGMFPEEVLVSPEVDVTGKVFSMKPGLGAVAIEAQPIRPATPDANTLRIYVHDTYTNPAHDGSSWALAYRSLNEALEYFGSLSAEETKGKKLEIYMQEHTSIYPRYRYINDDPQTATINVPRTQSGEPILIRGGFSAESGEDRTYAPLTYRSVIDGNPTGKAFNQGLYHCITVDENAKLVLEGFQIINGYATAGAQYNYGGGMLVYPGAEVTLRDCIFENNSGMTSAAIYAKEATLTMENCIVNNNTCADGASAQVTAKNLTLNHVTFAHNEGGTYAVQDNGTSQVDNTFAAGNTNGNTYDDIAISPDNFANPTNHRGATLGFDTYLGGYSNFRPLTSSKVMADYIINKGNASALTLDIAKNERNLGGIPDLGAYEALLPQSGRVYYVRTTADGGNDNNDGLSWEHPFATIRKAVNTALNGTIINKEHPQVWVAAGTYSQDPIGSSYNCFDIEDGVNVYGAFPKTGTPGIDDRRPLVSQQIHNNTPEYTADNYETILKPAKTSGDRRVLGQLDRYNPNASNAKIDNASEFKYPTTWDGFTLQNGYLDSNNLKMLDGSGKRNGGAGAAIFKNVTLKNCVVYDNTNMSSNNGTEMRAGGVYCDQGTLINCYILNNKLGTSTSQFTAYGGGCYMYEGTAYNCVISENATMAQYGDGGGIFIEKAIFFNNTITNNSTTNSYRGSGGVCIWNSSGSSKLTIYNCIVVNNTGFQGNLIGNSNIAANGGTMDCYYSLVEDDQNKIEKNSSGDVVRSISYANCITVKNNPAGIFVDATNKNYRLSGSHGLNLGINTPTINGTTYNLFDFTDMDYNARIQDCTIDMGAFERDNTDLIKPAENTTDKTYIYYVSYDGEGTADASSPKNAACEMKLQQVLTAAGNKAATITNDYKVIVRIAGNEPDVNVYHANTLEMQDNPMSYTYVIPYGITVEGGWNDYYTGSDGKTVNSFSERDISKFHTTLSPVTTIDNQTVNGFHTVSFGSKPDEWQGSENAVTTLDGLYLTGGAATSISSLNNPNTRGGAAIVPAWGHVRRCIIYGNQATRGGGLYLLPGALISGCLISENNADYGAGIYASFTDDMYNEGATADADARAHIFTSTIVGNVSTGGGGGIYTEDEASVGQDLTVWGNKAPADKNMSGSFDITFEDRLTYNMLQQTDGINVTEIYPYNNCFVETFEMPTSFENNEAMTSEKAVYFNDDYTLRQFSPLIKSGMQGAHYRYLIDTYNLSEEDINGLAYIQDGILKIDVGAFAFKGGVMIVEKNNIVTRIFVSKSTRAKLSEEDVNEYLGHSFLTPLSELDEALEYIKAVKATDGLADTEFEILITGGTYKPSYRRMDAQTSQSDQRQNSFVVPQGVSIYGGFSGDERLSFDLTTLKDADGNSYTLTPKAENDIADILKARPNSDFNGNGISEPWELANQTILSGKINVVNTERNVYHVLYTTGTTGGKVMLDGLTVTDGETLNSLSATDENEVGRGGAIYTNGVDYTLNRCRLLNNRAVRGNAIYARQANIIANGSLFSGNSSVDHIENPETADAGGGVVYLSGEGTPATLKAFNCLWTNNETTGRGGVMASSNNETTDVPDILLVNNTIACNKAGIHAVADVTNGLVINTLSWGNKQDEDTGRAFSGNIDIRYSASEYPLTDDDKANHNIKLNTVNMEVDGPRFLTPATVSGAAGDASTNQWNPAAISVLADAGNGVLAPKEEDVTKATGDYFDYMTKYAPEYVKQYMGHLMDDDGKEVSYVRYAGPLDADGEPDVKTIDIGLYEFQYKLTFSDMDAVYIATYESGRADGSSWSNASSDLRGAIVALSHPTGNSNQMPTAHKYIYVKKGDYDYAISQLFANGVAFSLQMGTSEYSDSLTIKGSYNNQGEQDFSNPSIVTSNPVNAENTKMLMQINANGKHVTIEGFQFHNPNGKGMQAGAETQGSVTLKNVLFRANKEEAVDVNAHSGRLLLVNTLIADGESVGLDCDGQVLEGGTVDVINATFSHNETDFTGAPNTYNTVAWRNDTQHLEDDAELHNVSIAPDVENADIRFGPNFVDPENTTLLLRNYQLRPSVRLLNGGSDELYLNLTGLAEEDKEQETELSSHKRFIDTHVDVGAYEYTAPLQPIIYVKSGLADGLHDGTSWSNATGDLQGAVDLAGLYCYNTRQNGYVFVHNNIADTPVDIKLAGAKVYGNMSDEQPLYSNNDELTTEKVQAVVEDLLQKRKGLMETTAHSSLSDVDIREASVMDGFEVNGSATIANGGMLSTSILKESATTAVNAGGILYNSFVDGSVTNNGGETVNITATGDMTTGEQPAVAAANLRLNTDVTNDYITTPVWQHQLNEMSSDIDAGDLQDIRRYTDYAGHRRDLAGNPRILHGLVDNGCMETWNIPEGKTWTTSDDDKYYPVTGSVVYLHEGANFVLGQSSTFRPGYLLLRKDASLYGEGRNVQVAYVGLEKEIDEGWNMIALPYALTRNGIAMPAYDGDNRLSLTAIAGSDSTEIYDGQARAASLYLYYPDHSPFWKTGTNFDAGQGFALKATKAGIYRFTGGESGSNSIVYSEGGTAKTVALTQYDLRNVTSEGKPNFTYKENMGWNLFGIPYLVSRYNLEDMDIPHVVYPFDHGAYSTMQTWAGGESSTGDKNASAGTGMFTQTAVIGTSESLVFPRPVYSEETAGVNMNKYHLFLTGDTGEDSFIFGTTAQGEGNEGFALGSDGLKLMAEDRRAPQVYATGQSGTRFSLMDEIDEEATVDIGVKTTEGEYLFSLGETADNDRQEEIWLTDRKTGSTVNLRQTDYRFSTTAQEDTDNRFVLSFSRMAKERTAVNIYTRGHMLYVEGVEAGRTINVYDTKGCLIHSAQSDGNLFGISLSRGIYVVNTSAAATRKVMVQ